MIKINTFSSLAVYIHTQSTNVTTINKCLHTVQDGNNTKPQNVYMQVNDIKHKVRLGSSMERVEGAM